MDVRGEGQLSEGLSRSKPSLARISGQAKDLLVGLLLVGHSPEDFREGKKTAH